MYVGRMALSIVDGVGEDMDLIGVGMVRIYGLHTPLICTSEVGFDHLNSHRALLAKMSSLSTH